MNGIKRTLVVLSLVGFGFAAHAESVLTTAKPEEVGLSSAQLKKIEEATAKNIDEGLIPGAVMLVARHGKLAWVSVQGKREPNGDAMKYDSIFRIYSMTKPMVTTALMQMVEEGRLQVSDPVSKFLPSMGAMKVGTEVVGADGKPHLQLADPTRPMTVQDLMRHTSGLVYGARGESLVYQAYRTAKIGDRTMTNEEFVARLSKMPLHFNPGDRWEYSVAVDVQGRLLEVLNGGKPLHEVLADRIFKPLGMVDTSFQVPADKMNRVAQPAPRHHGKPTTVRFKPDDGAKYEFGRRRPAQHDRRLPALHRRARQRRHAERQAHHRQADARLHDRRPCRQPAGPSVGLRLRPRLRGAHRRRRFGAARHGRRVRLVGRGRLDLLGRSQERAVRDLHDPGERRRHARPAHAVPDDGRSGTARLIIAGSAPLRGAHDHEMSATGVARSQRRT